MRNLLYQKAKLANLESLIQLCLSLWLTLFIFERETLCILLPTTVCVLLSHASPEESLASVA